jgi:hypothetical protein
MVQFYDAGFLELNVSFQRGGNGRLSITKNAMAESTDSSDTTPTKKSLSLKMKQISRYSSIITCE